MVTVPTDEALLRFLTSIEIEAKIPPFRILLDETFARKLLLGSMQVMGKDKSLRPDWDTNIDSSGGVATLLDHNIIHIVDRVTAVNEQDLLEAMRGFSVRVAAGGICLFFTQLSNVMFHKKREREIVPLGENPPLDISTCTWLGLSLKMVEGANKEIL